jgi:hypothetical protein
VEQLPRDDWTDQDLLTRDEAAGRLNRELAHLDRALSDPTTDAAGRAELSQRRDAIAAALANLTKPPP